MPSFSTRMPDIRRIALERVARLMEFAERHGYERPKLAREAVLQAMRIARKARVRIPYRYRRLFCRKCGTPFLTHDAFRVRVRARRTTHVVITCLRCGHIRRIPALREKRPKQ